MQLSLSKENIVKCLSCILNNEFLRQSQEYLNQCQTHKNFPIVLLEIIEQFQESLLRLQTFLLFVNVLKRNWVSNRRNICRVNLDQQKKFLRNTLIRYYQLNFPYAQIIDDITQFISKIDYPNDWNELHYFFIELLNSMTINSNYIYNQKMLRGLSIIRNVLKQQPKRRIFTNKRIFQQFTSKYTTYLLPLFQDINFRLNAAIVNSTILPIIQLKISRNIDRNILYILLTMNPDLQDNEEIAVIISKFLTKTQLLFKAFTLAKGQQIQLLQKYIKSILKNLGSIQTAYPFLFTKILNSYARLHINLLQYNKYFKNTYLLKTIIINLSKIISTLHFNSDQEKFKSSVIARNCKASYFVNNKICYQQFSQCFSPNTIQQIFQLIILEIFNYKQQGGEQIIEEQEGTQSAEIQNSIHVLGSQLLYQLIFRFQSVSMILINHLLTKMIETNFSNLTSQIQNNIYLMLLVLPKIFTTEQLPFDVIFKILEHLMSSKNHEKMFSIIVSRYFKIFNIEQLQNIFNYLVKICLNPQCNIITKYQTIVTIKKIMSENAQNLDISSLNNILVILIDMYDKFENPTLVWNIVNLTNKIIETVDFEQNIVSNFLNSKSFRNLVKTRNQILIAPVCELLENIIVKTTNKEAIFLVFQFIRSNFQINIDSKQVLYSLLVTAAQSYQPQQQNTVIQQQFLNLLQNVSTQIKENYPITYLQLLQEYLLMGIIKPTNESLQNIIDEIYRENDDDLPVKTSCLQLYLTLMQIRPIEYNQKIIILIFESLREITDIIKIDINYLRTNIITIINYYIIENASAFIQNTCNLLSFTKDQLEQLWLRNTEFLISKVAFKINSLAMLVMLDIINFNSLDLYFQTIIKVIMIQLQPIEQSRIESGKKSKGSARKSALKKHNRYLQNDFRSLFREKILTIKQKYNLEDSFIVQRISSPSLLDKISSIMNNQA